MECCSLLHIVNIILYLRKNTGEKREAIREIPRTLCQRKGKKSSKEKYVQITFIYSKVYRQRCVYQDLWGIKRQIEKAISVYTFLATRLQVASNPMRGWQVNSKTHLCVAYNIRVMPETDIGSKMGPLQKQKIPNCSQDHRHSRWLE